MVKLANGLRNAALAGVIGIGAAIALSAPASADMVRTRTECLGGACQVVKERCFNDGTNCERIRWSNDDAFDSENYAASVYDAPPPPAYQDENVRRVCNAYGDDCTYRHIYYTPAPDEDNGMPYPDGTY